MATSHAHGSSMKPPAAPSERSEQDDLRDRVELLETTIVELRRALESVSRHLEEHGIARALDHLWTRPHWSKHHSGRSATDLEHEQLEVQAPTATYGDCNLVAFPWGRGSSAEPVACAAVVAYSPVWSNAEAVERFSKGFQFKPHAATATPRSLFVFVPDVMVAPGDFESHASGLAGAQARGEAAKVAWVSSGEVVSAKALSDAWGLTPQALGPAARRGEVFAVVVKNQRYYPKEFLKLDRTDVGAICKQLQGLDTSEQLVFWKRKHGALGGKTILETLAGGQPSGSRLNQVIQLAQAHTAQIKADVAQKA